METNKRGGLVHEDGGVRGEYVMPGVSRTTAGSIQAVSACDAYWRPSTTLTALPCPVGVETAGYAPVLPGTPDYLSGIVQEACTVGHWQVISEV